MRGGVKMKKWTTPEIISEFSLEELEFNMLLGDWSQAWTWNHVLCVPCA